MQPHRIIQRDSETLDEFVHRLAVRACEFSEIKKPPTMEAYQSRAELRQALSQDWESVVDDPERVDEVIGRLCLCCDDFDAIMEGRLSVEDAAADLVRRHYIEAPEIIGKMGGRRTLLHIAYIVAAIRFAEALKLAGLPVKGLYPCWSYEKDGHLGAIEDLEVTVCGVLPIRSPDIELPADSPDRADWLDDKIERFGEAVKKIGEKVAGLNRQYFTRRTGKLRQLTAFEKNLSTLLFRAGVADCIPDSPKAIQKAWRLWRSNPDSL